MPYKHHACIKVYIFPIQSRQFPGTNAGRNEQIDNNFKLKIVLL